MFVAKIPTKTKNGTIVSHIIRQNYRDKNGKVKHHDIANISKLPQDTIQIITSALQGTQFAPLDDTFTKKRSYQFGNVKAVLGTMDNLKLSQLIDRSPSRQRDLVTAMIVLRLLEPESKLANTRLLNEETTCYALGRMLGVDNVNEDELYYAMDWLCKRQRKIEKKLAKRHLKDGSLVLYDVTSTYVEGEQMEGTEFGYNRDRKKGKKQVVFGMLCTKEGCPICVHVFPGNTADPDTLDDQVTQMRTDFGLKKVILVGDRGLITQTLIDKKLSLMPGLSYITALRAASIKKLYRQGDIQLELFDSRQIVEVCSAHYPGERLMVCYNPFRAKENVETRAKLLTLTELKLEEVLQSTLRSKRRLAGSDAIGKKVGAVLNKYKVARLFETEITETTFSYTRNQASIDEEAKLDGYFVIRTDIDKTLLSTEETVHSYKDLIRLEHGFRQMKLSCLNVRPMFHQLEHRIHTHIFLCMLAYYVQWHMIQALRPILFYEAHPKDCRFTEDCAAGRYKRSEAMKDKIAQRRTADDLPLHSFSTLLSHLGSMTMDDIELRIGKGVMIQKYTEPTRIQQRVFELLQIPNKTVAKKD